MIDIGWPQIIYIGLSLFALGMTVAKHGEPRAPHDVWSSLLAFAIIYPILWWGGFFH